MPKSIWRRPNFLTEKKKKRSQDSKRWAFKIPRVLSGDLPKRCLEPSIKGLPPRFCPGRKKFERCMKNRHKILCSLCLLFFLFSCGVQALYHGLSEGEANSILVILQENGIGASKIEEVKQNEVVWSIEVKKEDLSRAHAILVANNLPRKEELGLTGVYKEKGLIP